SGGDSSGYSAFTRATTPETRAAACDVPRPTQYSPPGPAPMMSTPGAATSTEAFPFEKEARRRPASVAPTATTPGSAAGYEYGADPAEVRAPSFPAAATSTTPLSMAYRIAARSSLLASSFEMDRLMTSAPCLTA